MQGLPLPVSSSSSHLPPAPFVIAHNLMRLAAALTPMGAPVGQFPDLGHGQSPFDLNVIRAFAQQHESSMNMFAPNNSNTVHPELILPEAEAPKPVFAPEPVVEEEKVEIPTAAHALVEAVALEVNAQQVVAEQTQRSSQRASRKRSSRHLSRGHDAKFRKKKSSNWMNSLESLVSVSSLGASDEDEPMVPIQSPEFLSMDIAAAAMAATAAADSWQPTRAANEEGFRLVNVQNHQRTSFSQSRECEDNTEDEADCDPDDVLPTKKSRHWSMQPDSAFDCESDDDD
jgi:hypothetical protein